MISSFLALTRCGCLPSCSPPSSKAAHGPRSPTAPGPPLSRRARMIYAPEVTEGLPFSVSFTDSGPQYDLATPNPGWRAGPTRTYMQGQANLLVQKMHGSSWVLSLRKLDCQASPSQGALPMSGNASIKLKWPSCACFFAFLDFPQAPSQPTRTFTSNAYITTPLQEDWASPTTTHAASLRGAHSA